MPRSAQKSFFKASEKSYGGTLLRTRKGRRSPRPLATKHSMHLVLRSSQATGRWSFLYRANDRKVLHIVKKFASRYGVKIHSLANVGNHLHLHIQLSSRHTYRPFIRAITGAIAMAVTGVSRWRSRPDKSAGQARDTLKKLKFWDYRPFTRVVIGFRAMLRLRDYIEINRWEGFGFAKREARMIYAASPPRRR